MLVILASDGVLVMDGLISGTTNMTPLSNRKLPLKLKYDWRFCIKINSVNSRMVPNGHNGVIVVFGCREIITQTHSPLIYTHICS